MEIIVDVRRSAEAVVFLRVAAALVEADAVAVIIAVQSAIGVEHGGDFADGTTAGAGDVIQQFKHPGAIREGGGEGTVKAAVERGGQTSDVLCDQSTGFVDEV